MKATIERATLLRCLSHVQSVVERRNTIPILSNVLIEAASGGALKVMATDLDLQVVETMGAVSVETPGAVTVSAHLLFDSVTPVLPASGTYDLTLTMHRSGRDGAEDRDFNVSAHLEVTGADAAVLTLDNQEVYNLTLSTGVAVHQ